MTAVLTLALARLWRGPGRWLLMVAGIAVATLLPVVSAATAASTAAAALRTGLADLPPGEQSLIVSYATIAVTPAQLTSIDHGVREQLARLTSRPVRTQMTYHQMTDESGTIMVLAGADDLAGAVRLTSGRMPAECTPQHCEMVLIGQTPPRLPPELGVEIVGTAVRTDPLLLSGTFDPGAGRPLLIADGAEAAARIGALSAFQRQFGWVAALDVDRVAADPPGYVAESARTEVSLYQVQDGLVLTAPDDVVLTSYDRAQRSTRRFGLLDGASVALLLGFAVIGAIGARRDHRAVLGLLRRRGAANGRLVAYTAVTAIVPVLLGTAVGLAAGLAFTGIPGATFVQIGATSAAAALVLALALSWAPDRPWRLVDGVVLAGAVVALVAVARGAVTVSGLQARTDPLLVALPVLVVVCGGLLAGRLFPLVAPWGVRAAQRLGPAGLPVRLGLAGAVRRPLRAVATVAFLAAATGVVIFAGGYRSTLAQGAEDQASFAVPLDAAVTTGSTLTRPLDAATLAGYTGLTPGAVVTPVLRTSAGVRVSATEARAAEVVGLEPATLTRIPSWERLTGAADPARSARLIEAPSGRGWQLPAGAKSVALTVTGPMDNVVFRAWLRDADGHDTSVGLTRSGDVLAGTLPALTGGVRLYAVTLAEDAEYARRRQHHTGEGRSDNQVLSGHLTFAKTTVDGVAVGRTVEQDYELTGAQVVVALDPPAAEAPVPVLVDPATAASATDGLVQLIVGANAPIAARIAQVLPRFPGAGERFVVADIGALADVLDAREPGTAAYAEVWISSPDPAALADRLGQAPFDQLDVALRARIHDRLATDPLAAGAGRLLGTSALIALGVAVLTLILLVLAERRDDAAELYAWESDGLTPGSLRGLLFARAAGVVAVGVPCGIVLGIVLTRLTTALVLVTAVGATPRPPLALATSPGTLAAVLGAGLGVGLLAAGLICWRSFRSPLPDRPEAL
ncbi:hypothetical protein [Hamadaea tsunoensis]|uniref:hypothetical protein n=1 Tax=Hamadaea tsunoensis TaxID=53368 RepID=UPI000411E8E1|nr:hypothetical protein [Hamadaea tsunoensis]